jgi:hypothetical protein
MIFVQTIRDRYKSSSARASGDTAGSGWAEAPFIRRPTRGIQIKEDTFATIRVVAAEGGGNRLLVDAGSKRKSKKTSVSAGDASASSGGGYLEIGGKRATDIYSNFLLQQIQEERMEKQQILETFGEAYIFLFGQRARVITFQGILANTFDFNWEAEWWHNYENYLRGTKCVENDARVYISYDNTLVGGYIISTSSSKDSVNKNHVQFQFQLFVTYYSNFSDVGNPYAFAGDVTMKGLSYGKELVDKTFSSDELAQYRPKLVSDIPIQDGPLIGNGQATSLFSALESGVAKAKDAWGQAQQVVNSALDRVSGLLNGDGGVRVPIGFAGSLVFNDSATLTPPTINEYAGRVLYTTFADNSDEFVGVGTHYGSSTWSLAAMAGFGETTRDQELAYGQDMVSKASLEWAKAGYKIPDVSLGPVSKFLVGKSLGLAAVGATAAWQAASTALKAGSADPANFHSASTGSGDVHSAAPVGTPLPSLPTE